MQSSERRTKFLHISKACEDYKNLTSSELQSYQKIAENVEKDKHVGKPHKIYVLSVTVKDRAAKLLKEQRWEYVLRNAASKYKNLTAQERREYEKIAKEYNEKREKLTRLSNGNTNTVFALIEYFKYYMYSTL